MTGKTAQRSALHWAAGLLLCLAAVSASVASGITQGFDETVNRALEPFRYPGRVEVFIWCSRLAAPLTALALVLIASALLWTKRRKTALWALWILTLAVPASMEALKALVARPRPEPLAGVIETSASFPSGTATLAAALYGFLAYLLAAELKSIAKRRALALAAALLIVLIAFSRMALSVHYLTDVVAGVLLGGVWVLVGVWLSKRQGDEARAKTG